MMIRITNIKGCKKQSSNRYKYLCSYLMLLIFVYSFRKHKIDFTFIEVKNNNFAAFINLFTSNTYMMIVMPDKYTSNYII